VTTSKLMVPFGREPLGGPAVGALERVGKGCRFPQRLVDEADSPCAKPGREKPVRVAAERIHDRRDDRPQVGERREPAA
jgi:hypothetical protein